MMPDSVKGSRKVEPMKAETPLWRKYVNYGLRELARAWYGTVFPSDAFGEFQFLEHFDEAMRQYALENGVDWGDVVYRIYVAHLDEYRNGRVIAFRSPVENAVWRASTGFLGIVRDAFLYDKAVMEYLDMGERYFRLLQTGKKPPFPRLSGIGALEYYEALEIPFIPPKKDIELPF